MITPVRLGQTDKLRRTRSKGRNSAVQSSQLSWMGQYKKCVQYDFKFTTVYGALQTVYFNTFWYLFV